MSKELNFETIARGRKADKGHTMVAVAESVINGFTRTYAKCQCGKIYSGWGDDGGLYGYERHLRNELAKIEETS